MKFSYSFRLSNVGENGLHTSNKVVIISIVIRKQFWRSNQIVYNRLIIDSQTKQEVAYLHFIYFKKHNSEHKITFSIPTDYYQYEDIIKKTNKSANDPLIYLFFVGRSEEKRELLSLVWHNWCFSSNKLTRIHRFFYSKKPEK